MTPNEENLIRKAQLKATGADIHEVNGLIGVFKSVIYCRESQWEHLSEEEQKVMNQWYTYYTMILSQYIDKDISMQEIQKLYPRENYVGSLPRRN